MVSKRKGPVGGEVRQGVSVCGGQRSTVGDAVSTVDRSLPTGKDVVTNEDKGLVEVLGALDVGDKEKLSGALGKIISIRLATELKVAEGIGCGLLGENITVEDAVMLLSKFKDSVGEMVKVKRLVDREGDGNRTLVVSSDAMREIYGDIRKSYGSSVSGRLLAKGDKV